jgi:hypothetical protein
MTMHPLNQGDAQDKKTLVAMKVETSGREQSFGQETERRMRRSITMQ